MTLPGEQFFVCGGYTDDTNVSLNRASMSDICEVYSVANKTWEVLPLRMPAKLGAAAMVAHGNFLYVIGGRGVSGKSKALYRYDVEKNQWKSLAPICDRVIRSLAIRTHRFSPMLGSQSHGHRIVLLR